MKYKGILFFVTPLYYSGVAVFSESTKVLSADWLTHC